jgi:hypothetical protein
VLDRVRDEDGEPLFTLEGGAAMELRLGITARASKDDDAAFRDRADAMLVAPTTSVIPRNAETPRSGASYRADTRTRTGDPFITRRRNRGSTDAV